MYVFEQILLPQPKIIKQKQLVKHVMAKRLIGRLRNIAAFVAT